MLSSSPIGENSAIMLMSTTLSEQLFFHPVLLAGLVGTPAASVAAYKLTLSSFPWLPSVHGPSFSLGARSASSLQRVRISVAFSSGGGSRMWRIEIWYELRVPEE